MTRRSVSRDGCAAYMSKSPVYTKDLACPGPADLIPAECRCRCFQTRSEIEKLIHSSEKIHDLAIKAEIKDIAVFQV